MEKNRKQLSIPFIILILVPSLAVSNTVHQAGYRIFTDVSATQFNHIIAHSTTGRVYVGAVNRIYQLSEDLNFEASAVMGPHNDSPNCPVTRICHNEVQFLTEYYNKVLLIDSSQNKLLTCGSLFQGVCTLHDLEDVSIHKTAANISVAANNATASTVAFIAPAPDTSEQPHVLYVGTSYTGNGHYSADVPAVSCRSLGPTNMLQIFDISVAVGSRIFVNSLSKEVYPITYIYGFSSEGFSYFVTVQKQSVFYGTSNPFISKLVRICQNDVHFYSYAEVPLSCRASDGTDYNLAQAAYVEKTGQELGKHLGIRVPGELFVVFAKSEDSVPNGQNPIHDSALCSFSMDAVRSMFKQNIAHCFAGNGETGLDFITPSQPCLRTVLEIKEDFCGVDVNTPLGGTIPIEATPILRYPGVLLTAIAATSLPGYSVVLLGTSTGHLKKVVVQRGGLAQEYSDILIEAGSTVNPDMVFDKTKDHIYVMTQKMVTKVKIHECDKNQTCADCLGDGDPFCGWCLFEERCLTKKACEEIQPDASCWFPHNSNRCHDNLGSQSPTDCTAASCGTGESTKTNVPGRRYGQVMEQEKLTALQGIAQSMKNIDKSLRELVDLKKRRLT